MNGEDPATARGGGQKTDQKSDGRLERGESKIYFGTENVEIC